MVKILSSGEIVQDDDPRLHQRNAGPEQRRANIQQIHHDDDAAQQQQQGGGFMGQGPSLFDTLNQRLLDGGFPRFNIGPYTIEPIVAVGFILAGLLLGLRGLLFCGLLFIVSKWSQGQGPGGGGGFGGMFGGGATGGQQAGRRQQPPRGGGNNLGGGNRLGRS